ncbi:hypothetical protein WR25_13243 [Diploscapter pachys]|uniref:SSD domain-containing protein n=1 Tax=Diploscapter pachys TaxID=2018661 RepID=A0A2A2KXB5_9BILA|nr:hypothetical protein WR25_13243 [Diploscapter pachys]
MTSLGWNKISMPKSLSICLIKSRVSIRFYFVPIKWIVYFQMRTPTFISSFFYHYGLFLSSHPHLFLFLPLLLTSLTLYPMLMSISQLHSQSSIGNIQAFTPSNSIFHSTKAKMASIFPDGGYFSKRDFLSPNLRVVILNVPSKLFEPSFVSAYALLRSKLESVKTDKNVTYSTACGISAMSSSSHCGVDPFLLLTATNLSITYPYAAVSFGSFARIINLGPIFGGARTTKQGALKGAKYIRMIFDFPPDIDTFQFDEKWMQIIDEFSSETQITSFFWSPFQYEKDMKTIVTTSSKLIPVLFAVLVIFSFCAFWNREDIVSSKSLVAVWGVISAVFGITTSIGLLHLFGIKLLPIAMFTPFLVLSIGIDDAFILLSSWRSVSRGYAVRKREKINQSVEELFAEAVSKYSSDVNSTSGSLAFSRFFLPLRNVNASSRSTAYLSIKSLLHSTSTANSVSLLAYDVSFPLVESSTSINIELMLNFLLIGASSVLSVGVLVPSLFVCLCLLLMLISINLGVFAFLFLCSARVDVVTSLAALLSIGYSIDYTNHLLVHYHSSDLDKALSQMSRPIIFSSISTVLGVLTLLPLQGYITYSFILCVVFVTIFGCLHSLFVVPVFIHFTANFRAYLM